MKTREQWVEEVIEQVYCLSSNDAVRALLLEVPDCEDAIRYKVLRDPKYQMLEDDVSVTDSFFNTYFEDDLDKAVGELKLRYDTLSSPEYKGE